MNSITQDKNTARYLPHEVKTRIYTIKLYKRGNSVKYECRKYHISKESF